MITKAAAPTGRRRVAAFPIRRNQEALIAARPIKGRDAAIPVRERNPRTGTAIPSPVPSKAPPAASVHPRQRRYRPQRKTSPW